MAITFAFSAWFIPGIVTVWSIMGSSVVTMICYLLPAIFYLKVREKKKFNNRKLVCFVIILLSFMLIPIGTFMSIQNIENSKYALSGKLCA